MDVKSEHISWRDKSPGRFAGVPEDDFEVLLWSKGTNRGHTRCLHGGRQEAAGTGSGARHQGARMQHHSLFEQLGCLWCMIRFATMSRMYALHGLEANYSEALQVECLSGMFRALHERFGCGEAAASEWNVGFYHGSTCIPGASERESI